VFTIEFILRLCTCSTGPGILRFCFSVMNLIDLLAILPWWIMSIQRWTEQGGNDSLKALAVLRVLRLTRVMRVFKMSRNFTGLVLLGHTFKKSASALIMLFLFVMMSLVVFATLMFNAESGTWDPVRLQFVRDDGQPTPFESIPRAMWWCIVTMTTVGYGDDTPITVAGYLIATVCMFVGLVILALPITIIGANFDELYREMRKKEHLRKQVSAGGAYVRVIARPRGPTPPNPAWTYGRQTPAHVGLVLNPHPLSTCRSYASSQRSRLRTVQRRAACVLA